MDPDGLTYAYDTLNGETNDASSKCKKFDLDNLANREISADQTKFDTEDEGLYNITINGWKNINTA